MNIKSNMFVGFGGMARVGALEMPFKQDQLGQLDKVIHAPYVYSQLSTIGGFDNRSVIIKVSLDKKSDWPNNIWQNSRYFMLHISTHGTIDQPYKSYLI